MVQVCYFVWRPSASINSYNEITKTQEFMRLKHTVQENFTIKFCAKVVSAKTSQTGEIILFTAAGTITVCHTPFSWLLAWQSMRGKLVYKISGLIFSIRLRNGFTKLLVKWHWNLPFKGSLMTIITSEIKGTVSPEMCAKQVHRHIDQA
jgi:hypothetical protein